MYDMYYRDYDPAIGRWVVMDPVTHFDLSPYNAFDNNPVFWSDPSGGNSQVDGKTDMWGRDRFDSFGMYIPYGERGEIDVSMGFEDEDVDEGDGGCPSCQTEADWQAYYQQVDNLEAMVGADRISASFEEGDMTHMTYYLDGKVIDLVVVNNRVEAFAKLVNNSAMIESSAKLLKALSNVFKSSKVVTNAESLIKAAQSTFGKPLKHGELQGFVKGNAVAIFKSITNGGTLLPSGAVEMSNGVNRQQKVD